MDRSNCEFIAVNKEAGALHLTLNRPAKKNAITGEMYQALTEQLNSADLDPSILLVLISAEGDYFCAGNDLNGLEKVRDIPYQERPGYQFMQTLAAFQKPVVAAINGHAIGIGVTMLLHCDLVYAKPDIRFTLPFVDIGIVPEFASTLLLPQIAGYAKTAELLLLGKPFSSEQAIEIGLINEVYSDGDIVEYATQICQQLATKSSNALIATKRLIKKPVIASIAETIEFETIELSRCLRQINLTH